MKNVLLFHNITAPPYRVPMFNALGSRCNLGLVFYDGQTKDRQWKTAATKNSYSSLWLKHFRLLFFVINPGLLVYLIRKKADVYIIIDNEENIISNSCVALFARLTGRTYIVWSGHLLIQNGTVHPMSFHQSFFHKQPFKALFERLTKTLNQWLYKYASSYLAYSVKSQEYLTANGVNGDSIIVGTQAMSKTLLPTPKKKLDLKKNKINLLYLGYLRPEKGLNFFLEVFASLEDADRYELHIVGDGPEKNALERDSSRNVHFYPYAHADQRAEWFRSADLMILPTFYDPWAHVVTESLHYGTPVLTTSSAAASTVITDGSDGFVFRAGDKHSLLDILRMLDKKKVVAMKAFIARKSYSRLYDVDADAENFARAIELAEVKKS